MAANCFLSQIAHFHANSDVLAKSEGDVNQKLNVNHSLTRHSLSVAILMIYWSTFKESRSAVDPYVY